VGAARDVWRNMLILGGGYVARTVLRLGAIYFISNYFSKADYGVYGFVFGYLFFFQTLADLGITTYLTREISRDPSRVDELVGTGLALRVMLAAASIALAAGGLFAIGRPPTVQLVSLIGSLSFLTLICGTFDAVFRARMRNEYATVADVVASAGFLAGCVFLVAHRGTLADLAWVVVISSLPPGLLKAYFARHYVRPRLSIGGQLWRSMLAVSPLLFLSKMLHVLYYRADVFMLGLMRGDEAVAEYYVAFQLVDPFSAMPTIFVMTIFPLMARYYVQGEGKLEDSYRTAMRYMALLAFPLAVGATLASRKAILFIFPDTYAASSPILSLLIWAQALVFLRMVLDNVIVAADRIALGAAINGATLVLNIALNFALIPRIGPMGAASATLASSLFATGVRYYYVRRDICGVGWVRLLCRAALPSAAVAAVVVTTAKAHILLTVAAAALALGVVGYWLYFTPRDRSIIRRAVLGKEEA